MKDSWSMSRSSPGIVKLGGRRTRGTEETIGTPKGTEVSGRLGPATNCTAGTASTEEATAAAAADSEEALAAEAEAKEAVEDSSADAEEAPEDTSAGAEVATEDEATEEADKVTAEVLEEGPPSTAAERPEAAVASSSVDGSS